MFYKFRSLDNFQFVTDIVVNQRLYAATLDTMNDPMEGFYTHDPDIPQESLDALQQHQKSLKFSSLSKYNYNPLMWAHYADGYRGIAIGVEAKNEDWREVSYEKHSHLLANKPTTLERAKKVLTYKAGFWRYEDEIRIFAKSGNYVPVKVKEIIFGERTDRTLKALLKKIIRAVNPKVKLTDWDEEMSYVSSEPVYKSKTLKGL